MCVICLNYQLMKKPKLTKSGYDNNYTQYESKGDRILLIQEYLALIEKYLREVNGKCNCVQKLILYL